MKLPDRKITPADLESFVDKEFFFTASQGVKAAGYLPFDTEVPASLYCMTFCVIVMTNGFILTGKSACADPADFNAELGQKLAREDAIKKLWPLLGFMRRDQLHEAEQVKEVNELADLIAEHDKVRAELTNLSVLLSTKAHTGEELAKTKLRHSELVDRSNAMWERRQKLEGRAA